MENKFFISSLEEAAKNTMFPYRWMPVKTWAESINHYYKLPLSLVCNSTKLLNAVTRTKWFNTAIETTGVIDDELSLYRNRHCPKGGKQIYCFYVAPKGVKPTIKEKQWHNYIDYAYDLLNKKNTRSETLYLSEGTKELAQQKIPETKTSKLVYTDSPKKKRKLGEEDPQPSPARDAIVLCANSPSLQSSQPLPAKRSDEILSETYWDSSKAENVFSPTDEESNALEAVNNQIKLLHERLETPVS
jgi:hypothetical protein